MGSPVFSVTSQDKLHLENYTSSTTLKILDWQTVARKSLARITVKSSIMDSAEKESFGMVRMAKKKPQTKMTTDTLHFCLALCSGTLNTTRDKFTEKIPQRRTRCSPPRAVCDGDNHPFQTIFE